jgi:hypothetical protein
MAESEQTLGNQTSLSPTSFVQCSPLFTLNTTPTTRRSPLIPVSRLIKSSRSCLYKYRPSFVRSPCGLGTPHSPLPTCTSFQLPTFMSLEAASVVRIIKLEDRKRASDLDDSTSRPLKRQATMATNGTDNSVTFGAISSPWQVELDVGSNSLPPPDEINQGIFDANQFPRLTRKMPSFGICARLGERRRC